MSWKGVKRKLYSYVLRVEPKWETDIYREIRIDGSRTLSELHSVIMKTYEIERPDKQYMFSMNNIAFDENGYYSLQAADGEDRKATYTVIDDLRLNVNSKVLYLYDFGRTKIFDITVISREPVMTPSETEVIAAQGELDEFGKEYNPYEGVDFLFNNKMHPTTFRTEADEYDYDENLCHISEFHRDVLRGILKDNFYPNHRGTRKSSIIAACLGANMYRIFQILSIDAIETLEWFYSAGISELKGSVSRRNIRQLYALSSFGFLDVSVEPGGSRDRYIFYRPYDYPHYAQFFASHQFKNMYTRIKKLDNAVKAVFAMYGVVDLELLTSSLKRMFDIDESYVEIAIHTVYPRVLEKSLFLGQHNYVDIVSKYAGDDLFDLLKIRHEISPMKFKRFTKEEARIIAEEGMKGIIPGTRELEDALYEHTFLPRFAAEHLVEDIVEYRCGGDSIDTIREYVEGKLSCSWDDITPDIRQLISNILEECPIHAYGGYSAKEIGEKYNKLLQ